jgi:two-component system, LytTR family, sensor kinase
MASRESINSFLFTLLGFKRARSKVHILLIVLIHLTGWCLLFFLPVLLYPVRVNDSRFVARELIDKSVFVLMFYLNYYVFIPRFFEKKKYLAYCGLAILSFLVYFVQHVMVRASYFPRPGGPFQFIHIAAPPPQADRGYFLFERNATGIAIGMDMPAPIDDTLLPTRTFTRRISPDSIDRFMPAFPMRQLGMFGIPKGIWAISLNNTLSSFALLLLMGGFIRLSYSFVRNQNEKKALENANLNAEVNFLKSQINPHFLFNTLNGIYSQAHAKSENTEHSILKLSDLLRYVLYDSGDEKVDLSKDIQYLTNYIDLQKLRLSQKVKIRYTVSGSTTGKRIAPLLLITFVENAFKHGISYSRPSTINIDIGIFEKTLTLLVSNPVIESNSFVHGGLGLKNVTRRLDLLYPGKYWLDIVQNDHLYIVNLKINLNSD